MHKSCSLNSVMLARTVTSLPSIRLLRSRTTTDGGKLLGVAIRKKWYQKLRLLLLNKLNARILFPEIGYAGEDRDQLTQYTPVEKSYNYKW